MCIEKSLQSISLRELNQNVVLIDKFEVVYIIIILRKRNIVSQKFRKKVFRHCRWSLSNCINVV